MNSIQHIFNWPSKVIALLAFLGSTAALGHAQTVLINDTGSGFYNGLGGSYPDTTDVAGTQWVSGHYNRGINATWSPGQGVISDYAGNDTKGAGISFAGYGLSVLTLSVDSYKSTSDQAGSTQVFGFSTLGGALTPLDNGLVDSGSIYGYLGGAGGLAIETVGDGSGGLYLNGGQVASWGSPLDFTASTGDGSTDGKNTFTLTYDSTTGFASVTEAGDAVATDVSVGSLTLNSAGLGEFYSSGWNRGNGGAPDGFSNFVVTTQGIAAAPEPSTWALMLSGAVGLFFIRRMRSVSRT